MKYCVTIFLIAISLTLFINCSEDTTVITIEKEASDNDSTLYDLFRGFSFNVVVNNFKKYDQSTKSTSNQNETIKKEALFHVFIYKQGDNPFTNNHFYKGLYRTNFSGQLISVYDEIQLPRGIYDLYILSVLNSDFDQVPRFSIYEATSDYIYNKLDYAWCRILNVDIKQCDEKEVQLSMERSTVKFNVNFENGDSCTIDSVYDVRLTAPDHTHCYWNLYSGLINPAETSSEIIDLQIKNLRCSEFILPLETKEDLTLFFKSIVNNKLQSYTLKIPQPQEKIYQFGYSYNYTVVLYENEAELFTF